MTTTTIWTTDQWVMWKKKINGDGRETKVPIGVNGRAVSITNPRCYRSFENATNLLTKNTDIFDGIGFIFTENDPFIGIDLDSVMLWNGWKEIINRCDSYTELSPSKTGLHIIMEGHIPGESNRGIKTGDHEHGEIAIYDNKRFFTFTLDPLKNHDEVKPNQTAIDWLAKSIDDKSVINHVLSSDYRDKFITLWTGNTTNYESHSEADLAFCRILANNHCPMHQIDRIFRKSKLMRTKWNEKRGIDTYGIHTLEMALKE